MLLYKLLVFLQSMLTVANAEKVCEFIETILAGGFTIIIALGFAVICLNIICCIGAAFFTPFALLFQAIKWVVEDIADAIKLKTKKVE